MPILGVAVDELDRLSNLAGDGEGEAAGDEVEVTAVEDGEGHCLEDDEGDQDDQERPAKEAAGKETLDYVHIIKRRA